MNLNFKASDAAPASPPDGAFTSDWRHPLLLSLLALISGMAYSAAFAPLNWSFLAWVALAPLFLLVRNRSCRGAAALGFIWGYGWAATSFFWLREIEFFIPFALAPVLAMFPAVWAALVPFLSRYCLIPVNTQLSGSGAVAAARTRGWKHGRTIALAIALAAWWCCVEWVRGWIFTGLPWNYLAVAQWRNTPLLQICEFTGVHGVTFIIALLNYAIALTAAAWIETGFKGRARRPFVLYLALSVMMLAMLWGYRTLLKRRHAEDPVNNPRIVDLRTEAMLSTLVVQGDIPQCRGATPTQALKALNTYLRLTAEALAEYSPDLVVWPETAVPYPYLHENIISAAYRRGLRELIAKHKTPFIIGSLSTDSDPDGGGSRDFNSALLVDADGEVVDRYDKVHIVPFGEFVPHADKLPWLAEWIGMGRGLSRGDKFNPLVLDGKFRIGINICFEDVFPYVSRGLAKAGANVILVITNDAWYPTSSEPEQHLANCVFRAIETRLPLIRSGNNNCSCVIMPSGVIIDSMFKEGGIPRPLTKGEGYAEFNPWIKLNPRPSFYVRHGDIFIALCWGAIILTTAACLEAWRRKRTILADTAD